MSLTRRPAEPGSHSTLRRGRIISKRILDPVTETTFRLVRGRAYGDCEGRLSGLGRACQGRLTIHHRKPVSQGGGSSPSNLLYLCQNGHHAWAHNHPKEALALGWLVDRRAEPSQVPATIKGGKTVLLSDHGTYEEVPE